MNYIYIYNNSPAAFFGFAVTSLSSSSPSCRKKKGEPQEVVGRYTLSVLHQIFSSVKTRGTRGAGWSLHP